MTDIIGLVVATEKEPTTNTEVQFWVREDIRIRPFDIVRVKHLPPPGKQGHSYSYAVVNDLKYVTDGTSYLSSYVSRDFGNVDSIPRSQRIGTTIAKAEILYNSDGIEMPIRDGSDVEWADTAGVQGALGLGNLRQPISAGYFAMSNGVEVPISFEADYLIGPEGAHLNVSGISGLAAKTTYAMFLLNALQQTCRDEVSILIFNVKGSDLLSIDMADPGLSEGTRENWNKCNLEPKPFDEVVYFYPYRDDPKGAYTQSRVPREILRNQIDSGRAFNYFYDVKSGQQRLQYLFGDIDDPTETMTQCAAEVAGYSVSSWPSLLDKVNNNTQRGAATGALSVSSWRKFYRNLRHRTTNSIFDERATTLSNERRQRPLSDLSLLLRPGRVIVIDIEPLPDYLQRLVFGDVVMSVLDTKLGGNEEVNGEELGRVVVFADELNKYAPRTGGSGGDKTLTRDILEISERGRSLGVVLFGAEQFRTGVHDRVLGNCSTHVFGRSSPIEIERAHDLRSLTKGQKALLARLPAGTLMLQHVVFTTPVIKVSFPYPAYLIRKS